MIVYLSLVGPLQGCYLPVEARTEEDARHWAASSQLARLWCSTYTLADVHECIERFGGVILPLIKAD